MIKVNGTIYIHRNIHDETFNDNDIDIKVDTPNSKVVIGMNERDNKYSSDGILIRLLA